MYVSSKIPTQQVTVQGRLTSSIIRQQVFATDEAGNPTGDALGQHDVASGDPSPLSNVVVGVTFPQSGIYALVTFSLDSDAQEIPGTRQVTTFRVSVIVAPAAGVTVTVG